MRSVGKEYARFITNIEDIGCEIRIQPCRYTGEGRWVCVTAVDEKDDAFWLKFEDLLAGDNDYIAARDWLENAENQKNGWFSIGYGEGPQAAMSDCLIKLQVICRANMKGIYQSIKQQISDKAFRPETPPKPPRKPIG